MLRKGLYPYEYNIKGLYPYDWEKFNEALNADYTHGKRVCRDFEIKNWEECHDFSVQSNTLFLADAFENFWNMCREVYELDPARFLNASRLAWSTALKTVI